MLSCVGRGLCDELITRPKKSYNVSNKVKKPKGRPCPAWAVKATDDDDDDDAAIEAAVT
jgi:hypothetical protein